MRSLSAQQTYGLALAVSATGLVVFWLSGQLVPLLVATALAIGFLIGDQQRRIRSRRASHDPHAIVESIPGLAWIVDAEGRLTDVNASLRAYLGTADTNNLRCLQVIHPEDFERSASLMSQCLESGQEFHGAHRVRRHDGAYRWFRVAARPRCDRSGKAIGWYGTLLDIDDQKVIEETLRASERSLRSILDNIPGMIAIADAEGNHYYGNKKNLDYFKVELSQLSGHNFLGVIHQEEREATRAAWLHSAQTGEPMDVLHRLRRFDGEYRWFHARVEPALDENGKILCWYGLLSDVDDREKAQAALRASERELQLLVDTVPTFVWSITPTGEPAYINKRLEVYYGTKIDRREDGDGSKLTRALEALMHPDEMEAVQRNLVHSLKTGQSFAMRYRNRRADGVYRWVDARAEPLRDENGRIVKWYGVSVDIDDEIRAQDALPGGEGELSRASQLAGLAELSASIAHEVNQPLAAVITNSHACQRWLSADPPNLKRARLAAARIVRDANGAADVAGRIRALFTQRAQARTSTDLNEVIGEVRQLMTDKISSEGVQVETDLDATLPPALADRVQMQQVLVNLIRNCIDAMKSNIDEPKSLVIRSRLDGENTILVEVRDNGDGIAEPDRIFEPFFSTKNGGMGMGLAICCSILESHDGRLWAERIDPRGSAFSFTHPIQLGGVA